MASGDSTGKTAGKKLLFEVLLVGGLECRARDHGDALPLQLLSQRDPGGLLGAA